MKYLRFSDLVDRGIVTNRVTLSRWVKLHNFPAGILLGPNTRAWDEKSISDWLATRAAEREVA